MTRATEFDNMSLTQDATDEQDGIDLATAFAPAIARWKFIVLAAVLCGALGVGVSYLVSPEFVAGTSFMPPQPPQSNAASALASLGALSGLGAGLGGQKGSGDEYIALMRSETASNRIIKHFNLKTRWKVDFEVDARRILLKQVNIASGKKDALIRVEVTDTDPVLAAAIANQYVEELRSLTKTLAVTEAQQRRVFFERLLEQTRDKLAAAQSALEVGGYTAGALNSEPRSAAEAYARIKAELTTAEVKLQVMHGSLADTAPAVQAQQRTVDALAEQLSRLESQDKSHAPAGDYVNRYREYKYQETLFDLFARQYENARVDESREGALIQVVDPATPPERKSAPSRTMYALMAGMLGMLVCTLAVMWRGRQCAVAVA